MYSEDDYIQLSSLQHYVFCPRQCGLIHVGELWDENRFTAGGRVLHERVDSGEDDTRGDTHVVRSLNIYSKEYGLSGRADVVEFRNEQGLVIPYPVEYKAGKPKLDNCDTVQLCAQALCLEEMLGITITEGAMFYGKTRHRLNVPLAAELREETKNIINAVHQLIKDRHIPEAHKEKKCASCSLNDACMPQITGRKLNNYIKELFRDEKAP